MKKVLPFRLDLQFFSEQEPEAEPQAEPTNVTMTQEELDALLQKEADKRVTAALKKQQAKLEEETRKKIEEEKAEAARLAKLSEADRAKAEFEKKQKEFEKQQAEFLAQQGEFAKRELQLETTKILSEKGLPVEFMEFLVVGETSQEVLDNINNFEDKFTKAVEKAVAEKLKSKPLQRGTSANEPTNLMEALSSHYRK